MHHHSPNPRLTRFTPLEAALETLDAVTKDAAPVERRPAEAIGAVTAADILAPYDLPASPVAYADGWAVNADEVVGASAYSAAIITPPPPWVDSDAPMPSGYDAILPPDALSLVAPGMAEATAPVSPGEGVRRTGQDIRKDALLIAAGTRLAPRHIGILRACGIDAVSVRIPSVRLVIASPAAARSQDMVAMWLESLGAEVVEILSAEGDARSLARHYAKPGADLVLSVGGTGQGRSDCAVKALADAGSVKLHGVALRPGESTALGEAAGTAAILLPGRVDGLVAGALVFVLHALARISGLMRPEWSAPAALSAKATSIIGFSELFLGVPDGDRIRPVPLNEAGFDGLGRAVGWFTLPPGSEGLVEGQTVHLRPFQPR